MLQKTPLNEVHKKSGAKMVEFGGWEMPVQYRGVIEEHLAVRNAAGLFDVSHMGEVEVKGGGALAFIQELTINDASKLVNGQVQYSAMCYPHGGVVDDVTLYRFDHDHYLFCVNAANTDKDFAWMEEVLEEGNFPDVTLRNVSERVRPAGPAGPRSRRHPRPPDRHRPLRHRLLPLLRRAGESASRPSFPAPDIPARTGSNSISPRRPPRRSGPR